MATSLSVVSRWALPGLLMGIVACQSAPSEHELLHLHLLDDELTNLNEKVGKANDAGIKGIQAMVEKNHNQSSDLAVLKKARSVRAETQQLLGYLHGLRLALSSSTELPAAEQLADRRTVVKVLLSGGQADSLHQRLNRYAIHMRPYLGPEARSHAVIGGANAQASTLTRVPPGLSFAEFYFREATTAEALAALAQQEAQVLRLESDALLKLYGAVSSYRPVFDKINAVATAESSTVSEGETYRAELFLIVSASNTRPKLTVNGQPLEAGADGRGRVIFTAPHLPPGANRRTSYWDGAITIRNNGRDTTFRVRVPYAVVRK